MFLFFYIIHDVCSRWKYFVNVTLYYAFKNSLTEVKTPAIARHRYTYKYLHNSRIEFGKKPYQQKKW